MAEKRRITKFFSPRYIKLVPASVSLPEVATRIITTIMITDNTAAIIAATILTATDTILCMLLTEEINNSTPGSHILVFA